MKTKTTIIAMMFGLISLIIFASSAFAVVDASYNTYEASFNSNGNFIATTNPVDNVNVIGFVCADASCSTVSGSLWNGQVLSTGNDNQITLQYPTQLQSQYGYAIFYYKAGYVSWVQNPTWAGTGTVPGFEEEYMTKIESCRAPIDSFAVINDVYPNQPIMVDISASLDANTSSPFMWNNIVGYHPPQLSSYSKAQVTVKLTITNTAGQVVSTQQKIISLDPSETQRIYFDYTPTVVDRYTARVTTSVTDAKCLSSDAQFAQKQFNVIAQGPTNQCYTLLNNLNVQPTNQTVGHPVEFTFDKISNAYDSTGGLSTLGTVTNIEVVKDGQVVDAQQLILPANADTVAPQRATSHFTPQFTGYYTVTVKGFSQSCPYSTAIADTVSQSFFVSPVIIPPINVTPNLTNATSNEAPVWLTIPGVTLKQNSGVTQNVLNLNLYVIDPDSNNLFFSLISSSNPNVATCGVNALTGSVNCDAPVGGQVGSTIITVGAFDGNTTVLSSFIVTVQAVVAPNKSCTGPNGEVIADTTSRNYYQSLSVPYGQTCNSEARTCSNGVLTGTFTVSTCTVGTLGQSCTGPDGAVIADGASANYYKFAFVPLGNSCTGETRKCTDGTLSGLFQFNSCISGDNTPPVWITKPQLIIKRNSGSGYVELSQFVYDPEVPPQNLTFRPAQGEDISQNHDSIAGCSLGLDGFLMCWTNHGQDGRATVNVSVSDGISSVVSEVEIIVGINKVPTNKETNDGLRIMQFFVPDLSVRELSNGLVPITLELKNDGRRLKDVMVDATILETDTHTSQGPFDLSSSAKDLKLYLPLDTTMKPGVYTIRLSISDSDTGINRIEHRDLIIYPGR